MQENQTITTAMAAELSILSLDEIATQIKGRVSIMTESAIYIGNLLIAAKEKCNHGEFAAWLAGNVGFKQSTADNFMRLAREVPLQSPLAQLPYSKALALLSAPAEDREKLAEDAESASVRELKERIKQAEAERDAARQNAQNMAAQHARAQDMAEQYSQHYFATLNEKNTLEERLNTLLATPPERVEVEVEVAPPDYEAIKARNAELSEELAQAEEYAEQAEKDAADARAELRRAQQEQSGTGPRTLIDVSTFKSAVGRFMAEASIYANMGAVYAHATRDDLERYSSILLTLETFTASMRQALNVPPVIVLDAEEM